MKWYNNLKIGVKLAVGFGLIIILVIVLAGYSVITAKNINSKYSYMVEYPQQRLNVLMEANIGFVGARRALSHMTVMGGRMAKPV